MRIAAMRCAQSDSVSYLLSGNIAGEALLVDPFRGCLPRARELAQAHGVRIAAVLQTRIANQRRQGRRQFEGLLSDLGLSADPEAELEGDTFAPWLDLGVGRFGPMAAWNDGKTERRTAVFDLAGRIVEIATGSGHAGPQRRLVYPATSPGFQVVFDAVELRLADLRVVVIPVRERMDAVAYLVNGRLFAGLPVRAPRDGTPPSLLSLPAKTRVYPGHATGTVASSSIAEESQMTETGRVEPGWVPVVHPGGVTDTETSSPVTELAEAAHVLSMLHRFRVVDIRRPSDAMATIPGATVVDPRRLAAQVMTWPRAAPLLVVSEAGVRCGTAAMALRRLGFSSVKRLIGGMALWEDQGLPLDRPAAPHARMHQQRG